MKKHYFYFIGVIFLFFFTLNACRTAPTYCIKGDIEVIELLRLPQKLIDGKRAYYGYYNDNIILKLNQNARTTQAAFAYLEVTQVIDGIVVTDKVLPDQVLALTLQADIYLKAHYMPIEYHTITPHGIASTEQLSNLITFNTSIATSKPERYLHGSVVRINCNLSHPLCLYYDIDGILIENQLHKINENITITKDITYTLALKLKTNTMMLPKQVLLPDDQKVTLMATRPWALLKVIDNSIETILQDKYFLGENIIFDVSNITYALRDRIWSGLIINDNICLGNNHINYQLNDLATFNVKPHFTLKKAIPLEENSDFSFLVKAGGNSINHNFTLYAGDELTIKLNRNFDFNKGQRLRYIYLNDNIYYTFPPGELNLNLPVLTVNNTFTKLAFNYEIEQLTKKKVIIKEITNLAPFNAEHYQIKVGDNLITDLKNIWLYPYQILNVTYIKESLEPPYFLFERFILNNHIFNQKSFSYLVSEDDKTLFLEYQLVPNPLYYELIITIQGLSDKPYTLLINGNLAQPFYHKKTSSVLNLSISNYEIKQIFINDILLDNNTLIDYLKFSSYNKLAMTLVVSVKE